MQRRGRGALAWVAIALAVALAASFAASAGVFSARTPAASSPPVAPADVRVDPLAGADLAPGEAPASPEVSAPRPGGAPPPPVVSAAAPPGCPGEELEDPPGFVRPWARALLTHTTGELRDRLPALSRDASPELRRGLSSIGDARPDLRALYDAPDRVRDGFDVAVAATLVVGMSALARDDVDAARDAAALAVRGGPSDVSVWIFAAVVAARQHRARDAREAYAEAHRLAPDEPAITLALARAAADVGDFAAAAAAARLYLADVPEDARTERWAARMESRAELVRGFVRRGHAGISVTHRAAYDRVRVDALADALRRTLDEVARLLARDARPELTVIVYADREAMRRATCAPSWSGGIFDGVLHLDEAALARADWERVARHEGTHAQLSLLRGLTPTWLNEGLAQHLEGDPSRATAVSWARMVERGSSIPFASLEGELIVIDDPDDARLAYHQSLAMVRFLVDRRGARVLREAADAIEAGQQEDLLSRLVPGADGAALLAYLARQAPPRGAP